MDTHEHRSLADRPRKRAALTVAALLGLGLLGGCGSNGVRAEPDANPSLTTPSATVGGSGTSGVSDDSGDSGSAGAGASSGSGSGSEAPSTVAGEAGTTSGPGVCGVSDLDVSVQPEQGGGSAGSVYMLLDFRNTSSRACTLDGHPGVSFVGHGDGSQLGDPAARTGGTTRVRLAPGHSTTALLRISQAGNYPAEQCAPTTADGLRIYPPDSRASTFVKLRTQACQRSMGDQRQLTVTAVGQSR